MTEIHIGDSYFPFFFSKDDGLGNEKIRNPWTIYVAKKIESEDGETWEDNEVMSIHLGETVEDFLDCVCDIEGKVAVDHIKNAKELVNYLRNLATYIEACIGE